MKIQTSSESIDVMYSEITKIIEHARRLSFQAVNSAMVQAYWYIGKIIVEEEQKGKEYAEYGVIYSQN